MTLASEQTVLDLSHKILSNAAAHGANCLVVACPMCHVNLDMKQPAIERHFAEKLGMVIYYLTDVIGMALGLPEEAVGVNRHFVRSGDPGCRVGQGKAPAPAVSVAKA